MINFLPSFNVSATNQKVDMTLLDDNTAVPGTATFMGGLALTQAGSLYVAQYPGGGLAPQGVTYIGGKPVRVDGALIVSGETVATTRIGGVGFYSTGTASDGMLVDSAAAVVTTANGVAALSSGAVCEVGA